MSVHDRSEREFERELRAAARSIATDALPADLLATPGPRPTNTTVRRLAGAAVVLLLAAWLGAQLLRTPSVGASPLFRAAAEMRLELRGSGYACSDSVKPNPGGVATARPSDAPPVVPDLVCTTPGSLQPVTGAFIAVKDSAGATLSVHVKAGIVGAPTGTAEPNRQALLSRLIGIAFATSENAAAARAWLAASMPLAPGGSLSTSVDGALVTLDRALDGGYELELAPPDD